MGINIDPESLKSLAEDVDLSIKKANKETVKKLMLENETLKKQIEALTASSSLKVAEIVSFGWIDARGGFSPVSSTKSHSLGVTPSQYMVSISVADPSYSSSVSITSVTSTTVTVTVPTGYAAGGIFVLLLK